VAAHDGHEFPLVPPAPDMVHHPNERH
jgi:hypothetical protein